ncbi:hypothetical protein DHEL01_v207656 [Diaporthe helianthi]|uniref:Uncharacterized protein n=1 Tax=Diaporthe helianthi TaxID=158607 RepID=A0A2P5HUN5_DIAHE|nr:hypothetical protein DHEL01_v207656 [Diaporthe helianthi]
MAYDAIPDTKVYRFHLRFSFIPDLEISSDDGEETPEPQAFVVPLEEVRHLTRELRNLKRTEQGDSTELYPPITLPWSNYNVFCFVGLSEFDLACLSKSSTTLITRMFRTVHRLGLGINRNLDDGITCYEDETTNLNTYAGYDDFAEFILRFPQVYHVALLCKLTYGIIFRTEEDLSFSLLDDETMEAVRYTMMSEEERLKERMEQEVMEYWYSGDASDFSERDTDYSGSDDDY